MNHKFIEKYKNHKTRLIIFNSQYHLLRLIKKILKLKKLSFTNLNLIEI